MMKINVCFIPILLSILIRKKKRTDENEEETHKDA
jgi:hypothetical protein